MIPLQLLYRKSSLSFLPICFILTVISNASPTFQADIHEGILRVIDLVYSEQFREASAEAKKMIRRHPDHPAGYFSMAFSLDSWMVYYQSDEKEDDFYRYCDLAIEKGEKLLHGQKDTDLIKFLIGGADGYKGTYEARYERWITAFRYGWKGVAVLLELESSGSDMVDIYYGIGCYNYWRSALMKVLWWMPGIKDRREEGIGQLVRAQKEGVYTNVSASMTLIDILVNEERFKDALLVAEEVLKKYPESMLFKWGKARALFGLGDYEKAAALFNEMVIKTENAEYDNHFNVSHYRLYLARIFMQQRKYIEAVKECNIIARYNLEPPIRKRLEPTLKETKSIRKRAAGALKKR
jgi:tetratricopeptide (TPR) repeat protein